MAVIRSGRVSASVIIGNSVGGGSGALRFSRHVAQGHLSRSSRTGYSRTLPSFQRIRSRSGAASSSLVGCEIIAALV
jgi:hypothetical protein